MFIASFVKWITRPLWAPVRMAILAIVILFLIAELTVHSTWRDKAAAVWGWIRATPRVAVTIVHRVQAAYHDALQIARDVQDLGTRAQTLQPDIGGRNIKWS